MSIRYSVKRLRCITKGSFPALKSYNPFLNFHHKIEFILFIVDCNVIPLLYSGITIGFYCPAIYSVNEDAGSVSVTVEILRGTPARDVIVSLQTVNGSAVGKVPFYL